MCLDCDMRGMDCTGTFEQAWTGCTHRKAKAEMSASVPIIPRDKLEERHVNMAALRRGA